MAQPQEELIRRILGPDCIAIAFQIEQSDWAGWIKNFPRDVGISLVEESIAAFDKLDIRLFGGVSPLVSLSESAPKDAVTLFALPSLPAANIADFCHAREPQSSDKRWEAFFSKIQTEESDPNDSPWIWVRQTLIEIGKVAEFLVHYATPLTIEAKFTKPISEAQATIVGEMVYDISSGDENLLEDDLAKSIQSQGGFTDRCAMKFKLLKLQTSL